MELGNMFFGNSRGQYAIERHQGWEDQLDRLFTLIDPNFYYPPAFENNVFSVFPYYWGDCTCGVEDQPEETQEEYHKDTCLLAKPNFLYKPTGFEIEWYKYPLRDSYKNQNISLVEFSQIIDDCIKSLK